MKKMRIKQLNLSAILRGHLINGPEQESSTRNGTEAGPS